MGESAPIVPESRHPWNRAFWKFGTHVAFILLFYITYCCVVRELVDNFARWLCFCRSDLGINKLTVGKIYAGMLIVENWRAYKASGSQQGAVNSQVTYLLYNSTDGHGLG